MGIFPSLLCPSPRSTSPNTMQCSADSYLQKHQQGCAKQQSPHRSLLSSFSDTHTHKKKTFFVRQRYKDTANSNVNTTQLLIHTHAGIHISILRITLLFLFQLSAAIPPRASTQHPEITAFPSGGQAGRHCYLMSVGMSPWACLLVPASQASIHVESAQSIKQLADSSALSLLLSSSSSLYLSLFLPICLTLSASLRYVPIPVYF